LEKVEKVKRLACHHPCLRGDGGGERAWRPRCPWRRARACVPCLRTCAGCISVCSLPTAPASCTACQPPARHPWSSNVCQARPSSRPRCPTRPPSSPAASATSSCSRSLPLRERASCAPASARLPCARLAAGARGGTPVYVTPCAQAAPLHMQVWPTRGSRGRPCRQLPRRDVCGRAAVPLRCLH
jgi:hypothetical protein